MVTQGTSVGVKINNIVNCANMTNQAVDQITGVCFIRDQTEHTEH